MALNVAIKFPPGMPLAQFDKQCSTLCLVPRTWAHSRCRSTAWSLGAVQGKFFNFELIPLNIHPQPTIFIAKAGITLNDVGSVSCVNLLKNTASHWYWAFKNHNGRSRTSLHMPRNKVESKANGFTETTSASRPILKQKLPHKQFQIFFFFLKASGPGTATVGFGRHDQAAPDISIKRRQLYLIPQSAYLVVFQHHFDIEKWVGSRLGITIDGFRHQNQGSFDVQSKGFRQHGITSHCVPIPVILYLQFRQMFRLP